MKKQLIAIGVVTAVGIVGVTGVGVAKATMNPDHANPLASLVDAVASKFNLNKTDVQKVFDDQRTMRQADQESKVKAELAKLVTDGKLTQAQVDKILAKRTERQNQRNADKSSTNPKTHAERETNRTALETWAKDNGISAEYLRFVVGGHGPGERGGLRGPDKPEASESE